MNIELFTKIGKGIGTIFTTIVSPILDKTVRDPDGSILKSKTKNGVSISSKRILNLVGTGAIISVALGIIVEKGLSWEAIGLVALGVAYSIAMSFISRSE